MVVLGIPIRIRQIVYALCDIASALAAVQLGNAIRRYLIDGAFQSLLWVFDFHTGASLLFIGVHLVFLYLADAYSPTLDFRRSKHILRLWVAIGGAFVVLMAVSYMLPFWGWARSISVGATLWFTLLVTLSRLAVAVLRPIPIARWPTVVVGAGRAGHAMAELVLSQDEYARTNVLIGFVDDRVDSSQIEGVPILGPTSQLPRIADEHGVRQVIVAIRGGMSFELTQSLLRLKSNGARIVDMPTMYKQLTGRLPVLHVADTWLIFGPGFTDPPTLLRTFSRLVDMVLSGVGLVMLAPVLVACGVAVKLTSRGPMLYSQERLGKNRVPFKIHKLRTMVVDAEAATGAVWSQGKHDPRVTRIGRFLRRSRLDEIPQLWNVLIGDMAIVGPRPERDHFVRQLEAQIPFYDLRFAVKPGVTGWAQVSYRYGASVEDASMKLQYELYAIQEMTPMLYLLILLKTVQTIMLRPGS